MKTFYTDHFVLPLPEGHRFPMAKYSMLHERVERAGIIPAGSLLVPEAATDGQLALAHDADYVARAANGGLDRAEIRRIGFPWSPGMVERSRRSAGATIAAARPERRSPPPAPRSILRIGMGEGWRRTSRAVPITRCPPAARGIASGTIRQSPPACSSARGGFGERS